MYVLNMIIDNAFVIKVFLWLHNYLHLFSSLLSRGVFRAGELSFI